MIEMRPEFSRVFVSEVARGKKDQSLGSNGGAPFLADQLTAFRKKDLHVGFSEPSKHTTKLLRRQPLVRLITSYGH
jgi:hypothetical protein